jgi:endonuclease-3 related protein
MKNELMRVYDRLFTRYGDLGWWPAVSPYEVMIGAVLTQNTAWENVQKAIARFGDRLAPEAVLAMETAELTDIIRPAGSYMRKAACIQAVTRWFGHYGFSVPAAARQPPAKTRGELLRIGGVGKETADAILLYALDYPVFMVDAYTCRLAERYPLPAGAGYDAVQAYFTRNLPNDGALYKHLHALIVTNAKTYCRKKPVCGECPLSGGCLRVIRIPLHSDYSPHGQGRLSDKC